MSKINAGKVTSGKSARPHLTSPKSGSLHHSNTPNMPNVGGLTSNAGPKIGSGNPMGRTGTPGGGDKC